MRPAVDWTSVEIHKERDDVASPRETLPNVELTYQLPADRAQLPWELPWFADLDWVMAIARITARG